MFRRYPALIACALAIGACSDPTAPSAAPPSPVSAMTPAAARERLAQQLARALGEPGVRAAVKRRLDASHAPEGKLQFQALIRADNGVLLASLIRDGASSVAELTAELAEARGLELYLPVAAQRAAWPGDNHFLVATAAVDGEAPVAFDASGTRRVLDPATPPDIPVLALVPQETDFTGGHPELAATCFDLCTTMTASFGMWTLPPLPAGLYIVQNHFEDSYESWFKGDPEYEYHVYGIGDNGESIQLACTGEHAGGASSWDQDDANWAGAALLISTADLNTYQSRHPGAPIRVVAWEDDDETCVDHADATRITSLISSVDAAYHSITSGKLDPWYSRGLKAAPSIFNLLKSVRNFIVTGDDFIGNAVETTVAGPAPGSANWLVKTESTRTTGWFTTELRK